jgi:hypothetical protein
VQLRIIDPQLLYRTQAELKGQSVVTEIATGRDGFIVDLWGFDG